MSRVDQVNNLLREEIALNLNRHLIIDGCLITVTDVQCTADLNEAKIYVSVLPEKFAGTALKKLRSISSGLAHDLRRRVKFHHVPTFVWMFDERPSNATEIDNVIRDLQS
ncbi:MAG: ribosome-binding factor A [Candidatus Falkowbacteria bacterium]|nr:ribosome-binding factor A [Candidatus Falkowbacteria bacterium]